MHLVHIVRDGEKAESATADPLKTTISIIEEPSYGYKSFVKFCEAAAL